ncbi:hypothetical protein L0P88_12980 [Muricauda sp. SCSIO 64092]|uniref:hypothetical protein n=1 Tax=Allomuricauda sp. SCSIO 64092 TaxID=2908842 RepID=UPI001FF1FDC3|nr:hypothetical protein [Muricauda sp. SCSIO 64092]UOY04866.1 hypothetical protein L0P88_12980 [Muricauda sp. SCSIO 64092]
MDKDVVYLFYGITTILGFLTCFSIYLIRKAYKENERVERHQFEKGYDLYDRKKSDDILLKAHGYVFNFGTLLAIFSGMGFIFFLVVSIWG